MHRFTITVNKKSDSGDYEFKLTGEEIADWEADLASHESEMKEYIVIHVEEPGTLDACLKQANKNYAEVQNLKLTGKIDKRDFDFMREQMTRLQALNLKEVRIKKWENEGSVDNEDNQIPNSGLNGKKSLVRMILPDTLQSIGSYAFSETSLSGSLIIPEGVIIIGEGAFKSCSALNGKLSLPSTLETIKYVAFSECKFSGELNLPPSIKEIGGMAFFSCMFSGNLTLPENLEKLEHEAFYNCYFSGNLKIPNKVKEVSDGWIYDCKFNGNLILPDGIERIERQAFGMNSFCGELKLPSNLTYIGEQAFMNNNFSGELILPSKLLIIETEAFKDCDKLNGTLTFPKEMVAISSSCFSGCFNLQYFGKNLPR